MTTGAFTCGDDDTGASAFDGGSVNNPLSVMNGTTTSTLRSDALYIATSTSNMLGLFNVDSSGNVSASGTLKSFGSITSAGGTFTSGLSITSGDVNIAAGGRFSINSVVVLDETTLGSGVVNSSLTSVGALSTGSITSNFGSINIGTDAITAGAASFTTVDASQLATLTSGFISSASSTISAPLHVLGNLNASSSLILGGAFSQTGLGDCDADNQTVAYDVTTGAFSCGDDDTGGAAGSAFSTHLTVTDGTTTSSVRSNALYIATSTSNMLGLFNIDSSGNVSVTGTITTFNSLIYKNSARPTRKVTLVPEFSGAVLTGDGTNNTGTMTSDFCEQGVSSDIPNLNTTDCENGQIHNYYEWTTSQATAQDYSIWVRWRVPDNFDSWPTDPISFYSRRTEITGTFVTTTLYDTAGTVEAEKVMTASANTWQQSSLEATFTGTYTPGSYMTFRIDMQADPSDSAYIGEIDLNYLANN